MHNRTLLATHACSVLHCNSSSSELPVLVAGWLGICGNIMWLSPGSLLEELECRKDPDMAG